jgi:hypothetical protein
MNNNEVNQKSEKRQGGKGNPNGYRESGRNQKEEAKGETLYEGEKFFYNPTVRGYFGSPSIPYATTGINYSTQFGDASPNISFSFADAYRGVWSG